MSRSHHPSHNTQNPDEIINKDSQFSRKMTTLMKKGSVPMHGRGERKQQSVRSPLKEKDLNALSMNKYKACAFSSSSSSSSSVSIEAPRGCLGFCLSHQSSSAPVKRVPLNRGKLISGKNPVSKVNVGGVKTLKGKLSDENGEKCKGFGDVGKPSLKLGQKFVKNTHCVSNLQSEKKKVSSKSGIGEGLSKLRSGVGPVKLKRGGVKVDDVNFKGSKVKLCDNAAGLTPVMKLASGSGSDCCDMAMKLEESNRKLEQKLCDNAADFTPVMKLASGSGVDCCDMVLKPEESNSKSDESPTPPVQASVSPEIQSGSTSMASKTPACYGAGHVLSGVSDKRKCKPRGILIVGQTHFVSSDKSSAFGSDDIDEDIGFSTLNNHRISLVPSPVEASMQWLSSPHCEKSKKNQEDDNGDGLNQCEKSIGFTTFGCLSSPSSSDVFSSEFFSKSNSTVTTSNATMSTHSSEKSDNSLSCLNTTSEFRGFLGPSFDHLVVSPLCASPLQNSDSKVGFSREDRKYQCNALKEASPFSGKSSGSGNVIRTPELNPSSDRCIALSQLNSEEISELWLESESNLVTETLHNTLDRPGTSFEFECPIAPTDSANDLLFGKAMASAMPQLFEHLSQNSPGSDDMLPWKEGFSSRVFEMDELDCCQCLTDEDENAKASANDGAE